METPSSMRRVTRSLTSAASQKNKQEDTASRSRNGERAALFDLTNDSPIVGLATGSRIEKTPSTWGVKNRAGAARTPGSGETLLRGQVKTLLQNVEEEAALVGKLPSFRALSGLSTSPAQLPATTPANTPQFLDMKGEGLLMDAKMPCVTGDNTTINPQVVVHLKQEESLDSQECLINRALLFDDSPGMSETSEVSTKSSSLTNEGSEGGYSDKSTRDDSSSIWSLQVNASIQEDDGEDMAEDEEEEEEEDEEEEFFSDLCEGLSKMSVRDTVRLAECTGKHTRFIYNSEDDEIEREEEEVTDEKVVSPNALVLRGLPAPEGKHIRFPEEEED